MGSAGGAAGGLARAIRAGDDVEERTGSRIAAGPSRRQRVVRPRMTLSPSSSFFGSEYCRRSAPSPCGRRRSSVWFSFFNLVPLVEARSCGG